MQQSMIVDELHVTGLKPHAKMEPGIICERVEEIQRLDVSRRQSRRIRKALRGLDIISVTVDYREVICIPIKDRCFIETFLTGRYFAATIEREWLKQNGRQIGTAPKHLVV